MARRRVGQELHDRERGDRFSRARFADQSDGFTPGNIERHAVDREYIAPALRKGHRKITDSEEGEAVMRRLNLRARLQVHLGGAERVGMAWLGPNAYLR